MNAFTSREEVLGPSKENHASERGATDRMSWENGQPPPAPQIRLANPGRGKPFLLEFPNHDVKMGQPSQLCGQTSCRFSPVPNASARRWLPQIRGNSSTARRSRGRCPTVENASTGPAD